MIGLTMSRVRPGSDGSSAFESTGLENDLLTILASGDVCSKNGSGSSTITRVRTNTIEGPGAMRQ